MMLGNLIIKEIINIKIGNPISFTINAPINPLTAGLQDNAFMKLFHKLLLTNFFELSLNSIGPILHITNVSQRSKPML